MLNFKNIKCVQSRPKAGNKSFYIFLFIITFCCEAKTQTEYITNGSFEDIDSCYGAPASLGFDVFEWAGCKGWSNPIASSSDLWCQNPIIYPNKPPFITGIGYQYPRTGNNMAGFLIGDGIIANYREYVQNKLVQTLKLNHKYIIEFYLSKVDIPCTTSSFGIKFFSTKYDNATVFWLTNYGVDASNAKYNFITDTFGWQKVSLLYNAKGTENYIVIGSFADSLNLQISGCDTIGLGYCLGVGYSFIDDVSITEVPYKDLIIPNVFSPNNDGINDVFRFETSDSLNKTTIYNRWGIKVFETEIINHYWDGRTTSGETCNDGCYYYIITTERKDYKGLIQLIR